MPTSNPRSLNCPTCGAPLELDGTKPVIRCNFCQNVILIDALRPGERPETAPEKSRGVPEEILVQLRNGNLVEASKLYREIYDVSHIRSRYAIEQIQNGNLVSPEAGFSVKPVIIEQATPARKTGIAGLFGGFGLIGCAIPVLTTIIIGGVFLFAMLQPGSPINPKLNPYEPSVLLPAEQDGYQDVVTQFYNVNDENRLLGRISTLTGKLIWKSEPLPKEKSVDALRTDNKYIFYVNDNLLTALNYQDGTQVWQVEMPDNLEYGEDSLVIADERIIAITKDRSIKAYNSTTGEQVWSRSLKGNERKIRKMGDRVLIMDYTGDEFTYSLIFINPSNGNETLIITPVCQVEGSFEDDLDINSGIVYDETDNSMYLIFGIFNGCVQRHNLLNGQLSWQYIQEDGFNFSMNDFQPIMTDSQLIFSFEHSLYLINKQSGLLQSVLEDPNYEMTPLTLTDNDLVLRARRTLGSERFELWGFNVTNGALLWQMTLENSKPLDPPNEYQSLLDIDDHAWTWHDSPSGLLLLNFQAEPNQLVINTINLSDGNRNAEKIIPFKKISGDFYSAPEIIGWQEKFLYFTMETKLYVLDTISGELVMEY